MDAPELQCYNRGCGLKYKEEENKNDSCHYHPGEPFFHDAYKGWSCCKKKCTDFTEFLNIKGCTEGAHSNIKPPEADKPASNLNSSIANVIEVKPIVKDSMVRPSFDSEMIILKPEIAPSLKLSPPTTVTQLSKDNKNGEVPIGTMCKNSGCKMEYQGENNDDATCVYHPGVPIFHEGLKYWSCCKKRTSEFEVFLNQIGCSKGSHLWIKTEDVSQSLNCRWDFHQTATHVVVSIYAKQYCPIKSIIKVNPIRLITKIVFPQHSDGAFYMDHELNGIIDVANSKVSMLGTKVEIQMKKAEPSNWIRLEIVREGKIVHKEKDEDQRILEEKVGSVDLSDL